ncbi:MAG: HD domain-containing protein [Candidatus Levybacteria bacterium]|nr:HD domain-containing protein [Candidatus Levybacteria bacterium]
MKNKELIANLFAFYIGAEKLKTIIRHSYTSNTDRTESSAEHSWMLCLIAMTLFEHISLKVDQLKVLKMLILHDLAEAITGDIPAFDTKARVGKQEREKAAIDELFTPLPENTRNEFLALIEEYEARETDESKVAQAIDKFEAPLQHNIFGPEKWDQNDFDFHGGYKMQFHQFEPFIKDLRDELEEMSRKKITEANLIHKLPKHIQEDYKKRSNDEN